MNAPRQLQLCLPDRRADEILKEVHRNAFLAYQAAVLSGDTELAEAAKKRFLDAAAALANRRASR